VDPFAPPFDLVATAVSTNQINLAWKHASGGGVTFIISFLGPEGSWNENYKTVTGQFTAESTLLAEGVFYSFRVRAVIGGVETSKSNLALTRTLRWEVAYNNPLTTSSSTFEGDTLAQRIDRTLLVYNDDAREVRLTLRCTPENPPVPLVLTEVSLSHPASPGDEPLNANPDPYDSKSPLEKFGQISLPGDGQPLQLPARKFPLDKARDLLVVFDVKAGNTTNTRRTTVNVGASTLYRRTAQPQQAGVGDRSAMTATPGNSVSFVEKIEVLTAKT
jgi:hypothetical protein